MSATVLLARAPRWAGTGQPVTNGWPIPNRSDGELRERRREIRVAMAPRLDGADARAVPPRDFGEVNEVEGHHDWFSVPRVWRVISLISLSVAVDQSKMSRGAGGTTGHARC